MALITNDAVVLGILFIILAFVFTTSSGSSSFWKKFYTFVPSILVCYLLPAVLSNLGLISAESSNLYFVTSRYLLPACLVLLTLSIDLKEVLKLGPKALILFFSGTASIVLGGPLALLIVGFFSPETVGGSGHEAVWRGLTTVAGSWIGGGANQAAMKEVFEVSDKIFAAFVAVDVIVANIWMAVLLFLAPRADSIDRAWGADSSAITHLKLKIEEFQQRVAKIPTTAELMLLLAVAFGVTALAHFSADWLAPAIERNAPYLERYSLTSSFFWLVVLTTTAGIVLSFTPARKLEGVGASRVGTVFLYLLVATIGMKINLRAILDVPGLFVVGLIWIGFHAATLLAVARLIKAPLFFMAIGSQANIGGAASAPVVAAAFHPSLAPVGVLLAVLGYALGTYGAWLCGQLMRAVSGG